MGKTSKLACIVLVTSGALLAQPVQLNVVNFNFSAPSVAEGTPFGDNTGSDILGWQTSGSLANGIVSGIYNPTTSQYSNTDILDASPTGGVIGTMGAGNNQALFLSPSSINGNTGTYQQILGDTVVSGMTYVLTVSVGARDNGEDFAGYVISLGADSGVLDTVSGFDAPAAGTFEDVSLTYTATDSDSGFLSISLAAGFSDASIDFTNVRLEAVPEASTWAAIGFAGVIGASVAWRQRRTMTA